MQNKDNSIDSIQNWYEAIKVDSEHIARAHLYRGSCGYFRYLVLETKLQAITTLYASPSEHKYAPE